MCRAADDLADLSPWDALVAWLRQYLSFAATKRAVAGELVNYIDRDAEVFRTSREALVGAGDALVQAAQAAGALRPDTSFGEIGRLVGTIGGMSSTSSPAEIDRMFAIVLDGLRFQPARDQRDRASARLARLGQRARVDDLEVAAGQAVERVQVVVVPAPVGRAAEVPRRAVVGEQRAVALQRPGDDLRLAAEAVEADARLQPHAQAHRRQRRVAVVGREVARGVDVGAPACGGP